jgi:hypothetical protein
MLHRLLVMPLQMRRKISIVNVRHHAATTSKYLAPHQILDQAPCDVMVTSSGKFVAGKLQSQDGVFDHNRTRCTSLVGRGAR